MADSDITALTELTSVDTADWLVVDDTSDTGTTKKYKSHYSYTGTTGSELQTMLTAANVAGGGIVECPIANTITTTSKIVVPGDVHLNLGHGVVISSTSDIDMVEVEPNGKLTGGHITNSHATFSNSLLLLDGANKNFEFDNRTYIDDIELSATVSKGNGFTMTVSSASARAIQGVAIGVLRIHDVANAVNIFCDPLAGNVNYINGNTIQGVIADNADYLVKGLTQSTGGGIHQISRNMILGISFQAGPETQNVISLTGGFGFGNLFLGQVFDFSVAATSLALVFDHSNTIGNIWIGGGINFDEMSATSATDMIMGNGITSFIRPGDLSSVSLPSASTSTDGTMKFVSDRFTIAYDTGAAWSYLEGLNPFDYTVSSAISTRNARRGILHRNVGSSGTITLTLPNSVVGMELSFNDLQNQDIRIATTASETFTWTENNVTKASVTGDDILLQKNFSHCTLKCFVNNQWHITHWYGAISYAGSGNDVIIA